MVPEDRVKMRCCGRELRPDTQFVNGNETITARAEWYCPACGECRAQILGTVNTEHAKK